MAPVRDNFSSAVKRALAERAAYVCANPRCLKLTIGPHSDPSRSLTSGHAAHICAAAPNGPRYDSTQTPEQRAAISNGIWLCRECGDLVDKDDSGYSVEELQEWKSHHDAMIGEIRTQGYSRSLALLQSQHADPEIARRIVSRFEDGRVFYAAFDAEFPPRVRISLDAFRSEIVLLKRECSSPAMGDMLSALGSTLRRFYDQVEHLDMDTLTCDSRDPAWQSFQAALQALRKALGVQIGNLAQAYGLAIRGEVRSIVPV